MEHILWIAIAALALWNVLTFALYGIDKSKAKRNRRRISEASLLACAFLMGGIGSLLGMHVFRHKTKHVKFAVLVPLALVVNIAVAALLCFIFG